MSSRDLKIVIQLQAAGDAPILKQQKIKISADEKVLKVVEYLRKKLHTEPIIYLQQSFSPSLEEKVGTLFDAFSSGGLLVIYYALKPAWG